MVDHETRKLQQVGGSTLTVSVPKDWADAMGLEAGDEVIFDEDGASLRLSPLEEDGKEPVTCVIDAGQTDEDLLGRCIVGGYILGYGVLEIRDDSCLDRDQVNAVHRTMRQLNGTSIVEQDDTSIRLRNFMDVSEASIYVIMRRLSTTVLHMLDSALYGLLQGRTDLLEEVTEMEEEVDVLYWLILRQLLTAVEDETTREDIGIESPLHIVGNRTAIKALEGTADCIEDIGGLVEELDGTDYELDRDRQERLSDMSEFVHGQIETAVESLIGQDIEAAHGVIEDKDRFHELAEPFLEGIDDHEAELLLHKIVWNLERIVEYSVFLAEIAINRSMEEDGPTTTIEDI